MCDHAIERTGAKLGDEMVQPLRNLRLPVACSTELAQGPQTPRKGAGAGAQPAQPDMELAFQNSGLLPTQPQIQQQGAFECSDRLVTQLRLFSPQPAEERPVFEPQCSSAVQQH